MISPIKPINAVKESITSVQPKQIKSLPDSFEHCKTFAEKEIDKLNILNNFINIKCLENLNTFEKINLKNVINNGQINEFYPTISGYKPACLIATKKSTKYLEKIKSTKDIPLETISYKRFGIHQSIILNKKLITNIIQENKDIFTSRLNLEPNTSDEIIYKNLKQALKTNDYDDLLGMTLGYPRNDSIIFNIEQLATKAKNIDAPELRNNVPKHKKILLEYLNSENSIYKNTNFKQEIEQSIKNIKEITPFKQGYYKFINYTGQENLELKKTVKSFENDFTCEKIIK